jgi:hypothetical protein
LQIEGASAGAAAQAIVYNANNAFGGGLILAKSRGTTNGSNTVVQNGDTVGFIAFEGADGSAMRQAATISAAIDGAVSGGGAADMPGRLVFSTTADGASSPTERMRITNAGNVLVAQTSTATPGDGNTTTGIALNNAGLVYASNSGDRAANFNRNTSNGRLVDFRRDGVRVGSVDVTTTATSYVTSSDYRLKENVVPLTGAIDRLQQIPVHRFNFIVDPDTTVDGFLAHEAQEIVPECVTGTKDAVDTDGNPEYQGIDQSKLVPLLTAALQEAIGRIETLEAEVAALKGS